MKQIGYGMLNYLDDNKETFHPTYLTSTDYWPAMYLQYLGLNDAKTNAQKYSSNGVFACPTQKEWPSDSDRRYISYGYNAYLFGDSNYTPVDLGGGWPKSTPQTAVKLSQIKTPSAQLTHVDTWLVDGNRSLGYCRLNYYTFICMRHNKSSNVLYADGHVNTESYRFLLYMDVWNYPINATGQNMPYAWKTPQSNITFNFSPY
jgi:prepilin-type processing-associated H-X9-DG protein